MAGKTTSVFLLDLLYVRDIFKGRVCLSCRYVRRRLMMQSGASERRVRRRGVRGAPHLSKGGRRRFFFRAAWRTTRASRRRWCWCSTTRRHCPSSVWGGGVMAAAARPSGGGRQRRRRWAGVVAAAFDTVTGFVLRGAPAARRRPVCLAAAFEARGGWPRDGVRGLLLGVKAADGAPLARPLVVGVLTSFLGAHLCPCLATMSARGPAVTSPCLRLFRTSPLRLDRG